MASSGMLRHVTLVRIDVSEERNAFYIRVTIIGELGTTLAVTSNRRTLRINTMRRLLVTASVFLVNRFFSPDEEGAKFLRNIGSYKSQTA
jgi:hypothetical protein